jgi:hypothetical protein
MGMNAELKSIERNLLAAQQKAIDENRAYMKAKMENLEKGLEGYLAKRVKEEVTNAIQKFREEKGIQ